MRRGAPIGAVVVASALLAACGVPRDESPRAIPPESIPPRVQPGAEAEPQSGGIAEVWLVNDDNLLEKEDRRVDAGAPLTLTDVLESLLEQPTEEELDEGLRSVIPAGVLLLPLSDPVDGELVVNLTGLPDALDLLAVAQIVYTATTPRLGVEAVRFQVEDEDVAAPDDSGALSTEPLGREDFEELVTPTSPGPAG